MTTESTTDQPDGLLDVEEVVAREVLEVGDGPDDGPYPSGTFAKIGSGMATLVALIIATYVVPWANFARPWTTDDPVIFWNLVGREFLDDGQEAEVAQAKMEELEALALPVVEDDDAVPMVDPVIVDVPAVGGLPPYEPHPDDEEPVPQALELPTPEALDAFYAALADTDAGYAGSITRVTHWGDSVIALDHVTSTLRELMQRRFGDAGHGFHLLSRPTKSYLHKGISFRGGGDWSHCYIINGCKSDGHYGLGGTTVWSGPGAKSKFGTSKREAYGRKASRLEFWYRAQPGGGRVDISVDGKVSSQVETSAEAAEDRWQTVSFEDGEHTVALRVASGKVRAYGVVLERETPGVVWDGMAQLGAFTSRLRNYDPEHLAQQVAHRDPALLVFQFGGNDLTLKPEKLDFLRRVTKEVIGSFVGENGSRACLMISPIDHGHRVGRRIESVEHMEPVTTIQREIAAELGCAFFDAQAAMGGPDSVALWRSKNLIAGDLSHLSPEGQRLMGRLVYLALMQGYREYRQRLAGAP